MTQGCALDDGAPRQEHSHAPAGRVMEGEFVDKVPGGKSMTDEQLETYLNVRPGDKDYHSLKRPATHRTAVLKRADGKGYYVVPVNKKFYKVEA